MGTNLVCTAGAGRRRSCGGECEGCSYLTADRRKSREKAICWDMAERRAVSNLLPFSYNLDGGDGSLLSAGTGWMRRLPSALLALLIAFNILDVILTARALSLGVAEANPVMAGLFNVSIPLGMALKFAAVSAGAWVLWRFRHMPIAARGMNILTACYGAVVIYHVAFQAGFL